MFIDVFLATQSLNCSFFFRSEKLLVGIITLLMLYQVFNEQINSSIGFEMSTAAGQIFTDRLLWVTTLHSHTKCAAHCLLDDADCHFFTVSGQFAFFSY